MKEFSSKFTARFEPFWNMRKIINLKEQEANFYRFVVSFVEMVRLSDLSKYDKDKYKFTLNWCVPHYLNDICNTRRSIDTITGFIENQTGVYLDAPFGLLLNVEHQLNLNTLSHVSFYPDFENKILYIKQVQGASRLECTNKEIPRMRFKISEGNCERILLDVILEIAQQNDFSKIALLNPKHSRWENVRLGDGKLYYKARDYLTECLQEYPLSNPAPNPISNSDKYFIWEIH